MRRLRSFFAVADGEYHHVNAVPVLVLFALLLGGCARKETVIVTAHRGASSVAPENTISAMAAAIEAGAEYAELDVRLTRDGEVVLMHDQTLDRTTDGTGELWDYSLEELRALDAGSWFGEEFAGEPIPTLQAVMRYVKGRLKLNIEIKVSREEPTITSAVVDLIRSEQCGDDCLITSFDREIVDEVKEIAPEVRAGLIFGSGYPDDVFDGAWEILSCHYEVVDSAFVDRAHEHGKSVHVWTVDNRDLMLRLIRLGVDGIISNRPALLTEVISEIPATKP